MTIIKEIFRNMFMSGKPIFRIDRNRYAHTRMNIPQSSNIRNLSNLQFDGSEEDRLNLNRDLSKVVADFRRAFAEYKRGNYSNIENEEISRQ